VTDFASLTSNGNKVVYYYCAFYSRCEHTGRIKERGMKKEMGGDHNNNKKIGGRRFCGFFK
jgi:hypothetical protein